MKLTRGMIQRALKRMSRSEYKSISSREMNSILEKLPSSGHISKDTLHSTVRDLYHQGKISHVDRQTFLGLMEKISGVKKIVPERKIKALKIQPKIEEKTTLPPKKEEVKIPKKEKAERQKPMISKMVPKVNRVRPTIIPLKEKIPEISPEITEKERLLKREKEELKEKRRLEEEERKREEILEKRIEEQFPE